MAPLSALINGNPWRRNPRRVSLEESHARLARHRPGDESACDCAPGGRDRRTAAQVGFPLVISGRENPHDGNSLRVEFTLQPEGANTRLRVIESGFARTELPAQERSGYVEVHSKGWDAHMENLRAYVSGQR
jgi:activator of Hsp90 ATPase-like protein